MTGAAKSAADYAEGDYRRNDPRLQAGNFEANLRIARQVQQLAERKRATPSQVALAWLLAKGEDVVPIPGTKRRTYLEENVAAAHLQLSPAELAELDALGSSTGPRYAPQMMAQIDR
ncbi:MAG: aldo/keto reductase [Polyangiaceae bacterium]